MLKLYNTFSRKVEDFKPIDPPHVGIYTCGPTVYREVHIGNFRTYIMADILRRMLEYNGYKVTHIKNITDVGHMRQVGHGHHAIQIDPIIKEALEQGKKPLEIAGYYTKLFLQDEEKLNIKKAAKYPKASEHVKEMIEIIKILLKKDLAYETDGTVYFNVKKFKDYGKLSGNTLDKMDKLLKAVRISVETDKKDSVDFALWKKAEKGRLMKWKSPWARPPATSSTQSGTKQTGVAGEVGRGEGFPGWHIECSAMSMKYLGDTFDPFGKLRVNGERSRTIDIHTGGEDLIFPHHEDEIAQSEGASGVKFVNCWLHGGYLLVNNKKMSRSKGNVYTISELEKKGFDALTFRYLTLMNHYRSKMNFTFEALEAAQIAYKRLIEEVSKFRNPKIARPPASSSAGEVGRGCAEYEGKFVGAINDDLNMPRALSIVWEMIKSDYPDSAKAESIYKMDQVLGLDLEKARGKKHIKIVVPTEVQRLIEEREQLRKRGSYIQADHIRNKIKKLGFNIKDTKKGVKTEEI